jgi:hypothetical protein
VRPVGVGELGAGQRTVGDGERPVQPEPVTEVDHPGGDRTLELGEHLER